MSGKNDGAGPSLVTGERILKLPLDKVDPNPHQGRRAMDATKLRELVSNIARHGLLQPISVRALGERYQVIGGHRRLAAFQKLSEEVGAGSARFSTIDARVRDNVSDYEMALLMLVENSKREEMSVLDEAESYQKLMDLNPELKTHKEVAAATDAPVDRVRRLLQLAAAPAVVKVGVVDGYSVPVGDEPASARAPEGVKEKKELRCLELFAALEFDKLHQHIARQKTDTKYDMRKVADEKVQKAIHRALRDGWGVRRVAEYVSEQMSGARPPTKDRPPTEKAPAFRQDAQQLVIYLSKLGSLSAEQKRSLREAIEPVWKMLTSA